MTFLRINILSGLATLCLPAPLQAGPPVCVKLQGASSQILVRFLEDGASASDKTCVIDAIRQLGDRTFEPAVDLIARYLDFEDPYYGWIGASESMIV
jgi:hypothetical protein